MLTGRRTENDVDNKIWDPESSLAWLALPRSTSDGLGSWLLRTAAKLRARGPSLLGDRGQ